MRRQLVFVIVPWVLLLTACTASEVTIGPSAAAEPTRTTVVATVEVIADEPEVEPTPVLRDPISGTGSATPDADDFSVRLPAPTLEALCSHDESEPPPSVGDVVATGEIKTTGLVDLYSFKATSLSEVGAGRPVVVWSWQPCMSDRSRWAAAISAYARKHGDAFQVVAVGMGGGFLRSLEMADELQGSDVPVVWSPTGDPFIRRNWMNGSLQLFSFDFERESGYVRLTSENRSMIPEVIAADTDGQWTGN